MKRLWKSRTFWFAAVAVLGILLSWAGIDDIGLYIAVNPVLFVFSSTRDICDAINKVSGLWYVLSFITMTLYGLWFDFLKSLKK